MLSTLSTLLLILPLLAAGAIALAPERLSKWIATFATLGVFAVSLAFAWGFPGWTDGSIASRIWSSIVFASAAGAPPSVFGASPALLISSTMSRYDFGSPRTRRRSAAESPLRRLSMRRGSGVCSDMPVRRPV